MPFSTVQLTEFITDVISHTRMITSGSIPSHGMEFQREMEEKYPAHWMTWLYERAGKWEQETPDPYMEGYAAFCDNLTRNPHEQGTQDSQKWAEGWLAGEEETAWIKEAN